MAARVTYASLGTDLGGSVRLPGSFCGVVGLKQTYGRVSQRGLMVTSYNGDHIGPLTRSVKDSAMLLQAIAGYDNLDPSTVPVPVPDYTVSLGESVRGLKMGIPTNYFFDPVDGEVEESVRKAIAALEELGLELREVSIPSMELAAAARIASLADGLVTHEPYIRSSRQDYSPDVLYRALAGQFVLGRDYSKALKVQRITKEEYARVLQEVDFLVTPTAPISAPRIDADTFHLRGAEYGVRGTGAFMISRNTSPFNITGLPAITVPCGFSGGGLPIGLQLIGRPFDEVTLLQVAHAYEAVSPTRGRKPDIVDG